MLSRILFTAFLGFCHLLSANCTLPAFQTGGIYSYYHSDHLWNKQGKRIKSYNTFEKQSITIPLAIKVSQEDLLFSHFTYSRIDEEVNGRTLGFEDVEVNWLHRFTNFTPIDTFGQLTLIIPMGPRKESLRYGRFGVQADIGFEHFLCMHNFPLWIQAQLGYRYYTGFPSDQVRQVTLLTTQLLEQVDVVLVNQIEYGVFNGKQDHYPTSFLWNANYRLWKGSIQFVYHPFRFGSLYANYTQNFWGQNVGTGGQWSAGILVNF